MDREFCIAYILDDCEDCPECTKNRECYTESHCFDVKQKIIADLNKLDKIEQIIKEYNNGYDMEYEYLAKIREVLENG